MPAGRFPFTVCLNGTRGSLKPSATLVFVHSLVHESVTRFMRNVTWTQCHKWAPRDETGCSDSHLALAARHHGRAEVRKPEPAEVPSTGLLWNLQRTPALLFPGWETRVSRLNIQLSWVKMFGDKRSNMWVTLELPARLCVLFITQPPWVKAACIVFAQDERSQSSQATQASCYCRF